MNIAFVCPMRLDRLTGTPIRAKTVVKAAANGASVRVVAVAGDARELSGVPVIETGSVGWWGFARAAARELRAVRPDIVHGITPLSVIPLLGAKLARPRVRTIYEIHGWAWYEQAHAPFLTRLFLALLDYLGLWFADCVIAVSHTERRFLARRTLGARRVKVVWDPVDFLLPYAPREGSGTVVGYIGNAAWYQGLAHIIDAARLLQGDPGIRFRLAGFDASDEASFPRLANVEYVGRVERADVAAFLTSCDIHVSSRVPAPVSDLQFPHKLSEYLAAGRSVIVSTASDQPMVIDLAKCGYVADPLSGETIARGIRKFSSLSPEARRDQALGGIAFVRDHLHASVLDGTMRRIYSELADFHA